MAAERPIIFAYDGSGDSRRAVEGSSGLLAPAPAIVVHVWQSLSEALAGEDVEFPSSMAEAVSESIALDKHEADRIVEDGARLAREHGFEASTLAVEGGGSTWPTIVELAELHDARVVVTGSRGLSGIDPARLGSVSNGLVHHSPRPVLVVPTAPDDGPSTTAQAAGSDASDARPIVFGYDGSEDAAQALRRVAPVLARGRRGIVLNVWASVAAVLRRHPPSGSFAVATDVVDDLDASTEESARATAEEGAGAAREAGIQAEPLARSARYGSHRREPAVWQELLRAAEELDAAALVVGSRGRSPTKSLLLGSVAYGVVHHARLPVLTVRREGL